MLVKISDPEDCVDAVIAKVGRDIRLATPIAGGKPNHLLNAFYRRAKSDNSIQLTIMTALTLERPKGSSDLERRFLQPFVERTFGNYPDLDYELDRVAQLLPDNVHVLEFYFTPAKFLGNSRAQRNYICSNFTHVARDILEKGVNVLAQQVAIEEIDGEPALSLSGNADLSLDLMAEMRRREVTGHSIAFVAQTNDELPFMYGDAVLKPEDVHFLIHNPELNYTIFGIPKTPVSDAEFINGIYCSALVKDGGELQVGIGAMGDSVVHALLLRHEKNDDYNKILTTLGVSEKFSVELERLGESQPFHQGLFAASEMVVDGFLQLYQHGIIKRRVYDDVFLQRLLNQGTIDERVTPDTLEALLACNAIADQLTQANVNYLKHYGIFHAQVIWRNKEIITPEGKILSTDLTDSINRKEIAQHCLGKHLRHGAVIHGGFFLGDQAFYQALRDLPREERELIQMRSILRINQLYGHEEINRLHRRNARFINTCMMITLSGAAVSDGLESGEVISGVGGQYNFVDMAQALPDGHSVLNLRATRTRNGKVVSNVVWNYGHITIPRHLRDVYVTEYGIAFVRGKTDEEIIMALLNISDSRFQDSLLSKAKKAGKLNREYQIPTIFCNNYPDTIARQLEPYKQAGLFPSFPFACEFTEEELELGKALRSLKSKTSSTFGLVRTLSQAAVRGRTTPEIEPLLERMGLATPANLKERVYRRLLCAELKNSVTPRHIG